MQAFFPEIDVPIEPAKKNGIFPMMVKATQMNGDFLFITINFTFAPMLIGSFQNNSYT